MGGGGTSKKKQLLFAVFLALAAYTLFSTLLAPSTPIYSDTLGAWVSEPLYSFLLPYLVLSAFVPLILHRPKKRLLLLASALLLALSLRLALAPSGAVNLGNVLFYPTLPFKSSWPLLLFSSLILSLIAVRPSLSAALRLGTPLLLTSFLLAPTLLLLLPLSSEPVSAVNKTVAEDCAVHRNDSTYYDYQGNDYELRWETYSWLLTDSDWRSYLLFDLRDIPSNAIIQSATLYLYIHEVDLSIQSREHVIVHDSPDLTLSGGYLYWGSSLCTWNNQPMGSASNPGSNIVADTWFYGSSTEWYVVNQWWTIDVTDAVRNNRASWFTLMIRDGDEDAWAYGIWMEPYALEKGSSYAPYLSITYTTPPSYEKCPDPEFSGGWGRTNGDGGEVTGNWATWQIGNGSYGMWNISGNIIDQATKVVYNTTYEEGNPVAGPNPPKVGNAIYSTGDGMVHWFWDEYSYVGSQVEGESYIWITLYSIDASKTYSASISIRWYAWTDDFDGPYACSRLKIQMQKPGSTTWDDIWTQQYTQGTLNTGWQLSTIDIKSYLKSGGSGQYKLRVYSWCHHDAGAFDTEHFAWWVDYVHVYVYEDFEAPTCWFTSVPPDYIASTSASFSWSGTDTGGSGLSKYYIKLDSGSWIDKGTSTSHTFTGLSNGWHTVYLYAVDGVGNASQTKSHTFCVDTGAPSLSKSSGPDGNNWINTTSATFSWSASDSVSAVKGYKISADTGTPSWQDYSSTSYTWNNLSSSTSSYYFRVRAYDMANNYAEVVWQFRVDVTAPTNGSPSSPANGTWTNASSITLSWSAGSDAHSGVSLYEYQVDDDPAFGSPNYSGSTSSTSVSISPAEGKWYWRIRTKDVAGNYSGWSSAIWFGRDATAPTNGSPSSPANGTWTNASSITLSWSAGSDSLSGVSLYEYQVDDDPAFGSPNYSGSTSSTSVSISPAEGKWYWRIRTKDVAGNYSGWSSAIWFGRDATAPTNGSPSSPANGTWTNASSITLSWSAGSDSLSGVSLYEYQVDDDPAFGSPNYSGSTSSTSVSISPAEGKWYWRIRTKDVAGNYSGWSSAIWFGRDATAPTNGSPSSPANGTWTNASSITLSWSAGSDSLSGVSLYEYQVDDDPAFGSPNYSGSTSSTSVSISPAEGKWYWRIRTKDVAGNYSGWSSAIWFGRDATAPTNGSPSSPANGTWTNASSITLSWSAGSDSLSGVSLYEYQVDDDPAFGSPNYSGSTSSTSVSISPAEGKWYWRIRTKDVAGNYSGWSSAIWFGRDATAPTNGSPSSPANGTWTNASSITLSWSAGSDSLSGVSLYEYQVDDDPAFGSPNYSGSTSSTSVSISPAEGKWYWRIRTKDVAGNYSGWSSAIWFGRDATAPTNGSPSSPANGTWTNASSITLSWSAGSDSLSGVSLYEYQVDDDPAFGSPNYSGSTSSTSVSISPAEGKWYWRIRTKDVAGNYSGWSSALQFGVDRTPPSASYGSPANGTWTNASSITLTWSGNDSLSGVSAYQVQVDDASDFSSVNYDSGVISSGSYTFSPPDGKWYWRIQVRDAAGNWSGWVNDGRWVGKDTAAPSNPTSCSDSSGSSNNVWQNSVTDPNFTWSGHSDSLSGVAGFYVYWGTDPNGTSTTWVTSAGYDPPAVSSDGIYYLRVQTKDVAGNTSSWATIYTFKLDRGAPSNPTSCSDSSGSSNNVWQNSVTDPNFTWSGHSDSLSGVAGFYVYWGTDPNGTSTTWVTSAGYDPPAVSSDGIYYLRVQTKDVAGNTSSWATIYTFKLDRGAPSNPTSCSDSSGSSNNVWQNSVTDPNFTWSGHSDSLSGVAGFYVYWGTDPNGTSTTWVTSAGYDPPAVSSDGTYYLRVQTKDVAGNTSSWATIYTFKLDRGAPSNPTSCSDSSGSSNNVWQNSVTDPNFTWSGHSDSLSGVAGFYVYWGTDPNGTSTTWVTSAGYDPPAVSSDGTYYLRVQTKDVAGNTSSWATIYTFKLDRGAPSCSATSPFSSFTNSNSITLFCSDSLSGVSVAKYNWDSPASETVGTSFTNGTAITAPDGVHTLYLWVKDQAGNTKTWGSTYYTDTAAPAIQGQKSPSVTSEPYVSADWAPDISGLQGLWYKVGSAPSSATDGSCSEPVLELSMDGFLLTRDNRGNHAYVYGAKPASGKYGSALDFDGADDYVVTPDLSPYFTDESVTISVWFYPRAAGVILAELGQVAINTEWHDSQIEILSTGEVKVRVWNLSAVSLGTASFNTWNHVVLRYDKASQRLDGFLNGVKSSSYVTGDRSAPWESARGIHYALGARDSTNLGSGMYFNGLMDEFRVYNCALPDSEVQSLYINNTSSYTPILELRFDDPLMLRDSSGLGNHALIYNTVPYGEHELVAYWYGGHGTGTLGSSGTILSKYLEAGRGYWIDYMQTEWAGGQYAQMGINDGSGWKVVNTTNFPGQLFARRYVTPEPLLIVKDPENSQTGTNWWDTNWPYRRKIYVVGSHPENYQLFVILPFFDNSIRFLENEASGVLPYWVENYTSNSMMVWIRRLENSDKVIYVYYGNPGAGSASSVSDVFIPNSIFLVTGRCTDVAYGGYTDYHLEFDYIRERIGIPPFTVDGSGYVTAVDHGSNPYGSSDYYFSRYRFLFVPTVSGTYRFATNSDDASEVTILPYDGYGGGIRTSHFLSTNGRFGWAINLDGFDDYVQIPYSSLLQPDAITISLWIRLTADPNVDENNNWRWILSPSGWTAPCLLILEQNRTVNFTVYVGGTSYRYIGGIFSGEQLNVGEWTHLVYVYDPATGYGYAYKNGRLSRSGVMVPGGGALSKSSNGWRIGWPSGTNRPNGNGCPAAMIDDLRIYNRPLTPSEVQLLYYNRLTRPIGYWSLNEGTGRVARDSSGCGNHATLFNWVGWTSSGKFGSALNLDGVDDYLRVPMVYSPFKDEATILAWVKPDTSDNVYPVGYQAEDYDGDTGEDYYDTTASRWVRRALVGTHPAGYLCANMNVPAGFNGPFALTTYSRVDNNSAAVVAWKVEVYENGTLKWSYSINANQYGNTTSYYWFESSTWVFDGSKSYTIKIYWPGNVGVYMDYLGLMARRGAIGTPRSYMLFQKASASTLQVGWYTRKSDGNWSYTWFDTKYTIPVDGKFHLVAVTLKNGVKTLYIDEAPRQQVSGCGDLSQEVYDIYVGALWRNFKGVIDEVCIYNRALTQEEIYRIWAGRKKGFIYVPSGTQQTVYVWARDLAGNSSHTSPAQVQVKYDPSLPPAGVWAEARGGKGKLGYTPASPPEPPAGYTWTVDTFAWLSSITSGNHLASPTLADTDGDGRRELLFGSRDGKLYVLWDNLSPKWYYQTGGEVYSTPVVADLDLDGRAEIVFSSADGKIYCIRDAGTSGSLVWTYNVGYFVQAAPTVENLLGDGKLEIVLNTGFPWVASQTHKTIVVLDSSGNEKWSFSTPGNVYGSPAVFDLNKDGKKEVVFGCIDGKVYILNGENGSIVRTIDFGSKIFVSIPVFENGTGGVQLLVCGWDKVACYDGSGEQALGEDGHKVRSG
jgi:hypothetical protein